MLALVLFLAFTVIPALETYLLIEVGQVIGGWSTVAWLIAMGLLGSWLGKRAGSGVLRQIGEDLRAGRSPADSVVEGALVLVGSVLLVTPGFLSDIAGMLLFIPPVRRFLAPRLKARALAWMLQPRGGFRFNVGAMRPGPGSDLDAVIGAEEARGDFSAAGTGRAKRGFDHPVG